jgi:high-affinity Fe2+/Pb2+ permease
MMLKGKKTYITGIGALLVSAGLFMQGQMELSEAVQTSIAALLAIFVRKGITSESKGE